MADDDISWDAPAEDVAWDKPAAPTTAPTFGDKLMQTWPARLAQGIYSGVTLPGDVATGAANVQPATPGMWSDEDEARLQATNATIADRAKELAAVGTPMSAAARAGEGVLGAAITPKVTPPAAVAAPTTAELKGAAKAAYESPTVKDVIIHADAAPRLAQEIKTNLNAMGVDENLAKPTFGILDKLEKVPSDSFLTVDNLRSLRRTLGNAANSIDPTERLAARSAMQHVDEFLSDLPARDVIRGDPEAAANILSQANANYSAMKTASGLDERLIRAQLRAAAANSGMNVANTIRQRLADILLNPKLQRQYKPNELAQMQTIVEGTPAQNALRKAGNILGGGGGLLTALYGLGSLGVHPGLALAPVAGYAARKLSNYLATRDVNKLSEAVRARSPLGQERQAAAIGKTSLPNLQAPLRTELGAFGLPQLASPVPASAQSNQQDIPGPVGHQNGGRIVNQQNGFAHGGTVSDNMRTIQVIRHGATKLNNDDVSVDRIRSWKNIPLSKEGEQEAHTLGNCMTKETKPDILVSSNLKRAHDTARIVSKKIGVPIRQSSTAFRPWNLGNFAGQKSSQAVPVIADYATETPDKKVPGGESFNDFKRRFFTALYDLLKANKGIPAIVTHHRNERLLRAWEKAGYPADGSVDHKEFTKKGEHTAQMFTMQVPLDRLREAARARYAKGGGVGGGSFDPAKIGARKAKNGRYYVPDPKRKGKYLMVVTRSLNGGR